MHFIYFHFKQFGIRNTKDFATIIIFRIKHHTIQWQTKNAKLKLNVEVGYFCLKTWESLRTLRLLAIGKLSNMRRWRRRRWAGRGRATSRRSVSLSPSDAEIACNIWKTKTLNFKFSKKNFENKNVFIFC